MVDFLKLDLDERQQPADVRLRDESANNEIAITQAHFNSSGVIITRLRSGSKAKEFHLNTSELEALCASWMEYQGRVMQHTAEIAERKEAAIAEAQKLASSVHFDLESLNIQLHRDNSDASWCTEIPAINFVSWTYERDISGLPGIVQEALDYIRDRVALAESKDWPKTHSEWEAIVTSYRRVFPLEPAICQTCGLKYSGTGHECPQEDRNEPAEIQEARELLTQAGLTDYVIAREPQTENYNFIHGHGQFALHDKPAEDLLELISQYITETKREQGENDEMIADFWARQRFIAATEQREPSEQELDIMTEQALLDDSHPIPEPATLNFD